MIALGSMPELHSILHRGGDVSDAQFDALYPEPVRKLSRIHWTPFAVAQRAAELLTKNQRRAPMLLDVGAGAGKFCLVGALTSPGTYVGIERSAWLHEASTHASRRLRVESKTCFVLGDAMSADWSRFDGIYFFNPFFEQLGAVDVVEHDRRRYAESVLATCEKLAQLRLGTRVVTYHGFGDELPQGYELAAKEPAGTADLELWVKTTA